MKPAVGIPAALGGAAALVCTAVTAAEPAGAKPPAPLPMAGLIETATVYPGGLKLKAKLDTGARTSSLGVERLRLFGADGRDMVEFHLRRPGGKLRRIVLPLLRLSYVKERGREATPRPVVMLGICIGNLVRRTEVNLQDRANFNYPLLIGRRYLSGAYAVDPAKRNLLRPDCPAARDVPDMSQ